MKKNISIIRISILTGLIIISSGCITEMLSGATGGALSSSFVGATTDLILHGEVNTDTLARNATSGAIAGGMAGGAYGHKKDKADKKSKQKAPEPSKADIEATKLLTEKIGKINMDALDKLLYSNYEEAYKKTLKSVKSSNKNYSEAGYVIQALIDTDRKNQKSVDESLNNFIASNGKIDNLKDAQKGLKSIYKQLENMRKVKGL